MRLFDDIEEYNNQELEELLNLINRQNTIYSVNYNEERQELNYRLVYSLNNISEKTIKLSDKELKNHTTLKLIETILLRYNLLKRKTRENINKQLINEYISTFNKNRKPLDIMDVIDKKELLKRIKERKNDITHFVDEEIGVRVVLTTLENVALSSIVHLIDQSITKYLLAYTFIAPIIYSYVPYKIDNIKNTYKYNKVVSSLENEEQIRKPNLKLFCVVNKKVHELENENPKLFEAEIKALQDIMEYCYTNGVLDEKTIDIEIVKKIEEVYSRIELKKFNRKTISFTDYLARKQMLDEEETEEKIAKCR